MSKRIALFTATRHIDFGSVKLAPGETIDVEKHPELAQACSALAAKADPALVDASLAAGRPAMPADGPTVEQLSAAADELNHRAAELSAREEALRQREAMLAEAATELAERERLLEAAAGQPSQAAGHPDIRTLAPEDRHAAIVAACVELEASEDAMTKDSGPKVEAIEELLQGDVTAAERDAAWTAVLAERAGDSP